VKVNFVTNIPLSEVSGGFSGMNAAAYEALNEIADVTYVGPINPTPSLRGHIKSKLVRSLGGAGDYFFFSSQRLRNIAEAVDSTCNRWADLDFFHGFTPWIHCSPRRPFATWSDCTFRDYVSIFHNRSKFSRSSINAIMTAEREWLKQAAGVFLSSEWAAARTRQDYHLDCLKVSSVGIFGGLQPPEQDIYSGARSLLFVSTDYQKKNGRLCREAMDIIWRRFPDVELTIIGAPPPASDLDDHRVQYTGFLDKSDPEQLDRFRSFLGTAAGLIHPTNADTTAMIVIEAAFFGCPSISVADFAIPEVTRQGESAILLPRPITRSALARAMTTLLEGGAAYRRMRRSAREHSLGNFSRAAFKKRFQQAILNLGIGKRNSVSKRIAKG
jgi:glycosyltransferase involved in cell wall biosynthesis